MAIKRSWEWVGRSASLLQIVTAGGAVISFLGGFFSTVNNFPLYWRIPFLIFIVAFVVITGFRLLRYVQDRASRVDESQMVVPPITQSMLTVESGDNIWQVNNKQIVGTDEVQLKQVLDQLHQHVHEELLLRDQRITELERQLPPQAPDIEEPPPPTT